MANANKPKTEKDYEQLGRMLENIYTSGYINQNQTYKMSFLKGLAGGVGGVIGATVVIGLLIWVLSFFKQVPIIGPLVNNLRNTVQESKTN